MQNITRKRTAEEIKDESKHLFKNNVKSLTHDFTNLALFTKRVKG